MCSTQPYFQFEAVMQHIGDFLVTQQYMNLIRRYNFNLMHLMSAAFQGCSGWLLDEHKIRMSSLLIIDAIDKILDNFKNRMIC
jgi:hypothetical protein